MSGNDSTTTPLAKRKCQACAPGSKALAADQIKVMLTALPEWTVEKNVLLRKLKFADYYHTISFVNAIAYMANQQDHHPDLEVGYNALTVRYSTHSVGGLSENDFICAAKVDALLAD